MFEGYLYVRDFYRNNNETYELNLDNFKDSYAGEFSLGKLPF